RAAADQLADGLGQNVAVKTKTSGNGPRTASFTRGGYDRNPDFLAERPSPVGGRARFVRVFPIYNPRWHRSHSPAHAPDDSQRATGERCRDLRRGQLWADLRSAARP